MTTNSSTAVSPDEPCEVCGTTRENHGDLNHEFSTDGQLRPKKPAEPPRQTPPQTRSEVAKKLGEDPTAQAFLRLIDVLTEKGLLGAPDLIYILGGYDAPGRRNTQATTPAYRDPASAQRSGRPDPQ